MSVSQENRNKILVINNFKAIGKLSAPIFPQNNEQLYDVMMGMRDAFVFVTEYISISDILLTKESSK